MDWYRILPIKSILGFWLLKVANMHRNFIMNGSSQLMFRSLCAIKGIEITRNCCARETKHREQIQFAIHSLVQFNMQTCKSIRLRLTSSLFRLSAATGNENSRDTISAQCSMSGEREYRISKRIDRGFRKRPNGEMIDRDCVHVYAGSRECFSYTRVRGRCNSDYS